jgi:hypothetical protein
MLGAAILAEVVEVIRDSAGDYAIAYIAAGWMAFGAGVVVLALRRARVAPIAVPAAGT